MNSDTTWLNRLLERLQDLLAAFGVPEASQSVGALIALYLLATLLVLLFVVMIWYFSRRRAAPEKPASSSDGVVEGSLKTGSAERTESGEALTAPAGEKEASVLDRMRSGLGKTRHALVGKLDSLFLNRSGFSRELFDELEEILVTSDFGMPTTMALIETLESQFSGSDASSEEIYSALKQEISERLHKVPGADEPDRDALHVIMVVGVNGVGKTTTIGKLASLYRSSGKKVLLGAGDTYRAAAADQLEVWAKRSDAEFVRHKEGGDPAAVAFDSIKAAIARKCDILILDTAGRLHTKANLMEELKKISRVLGRELTGAPHETLLVVDATTGQNALAQARLFKDAVNVDGIVLTKMDGTAKGGIVVAISSDLRIPVRYIGFGESVGDLRPFDADLFVRALFGHGVDA